MRSFGSRQLPRRPPDLNLGSDAELLRTTGTGSCWSSPASGPSTSPAAATLASSSEITVDQDAGRLERSAARHRRPWVAPEAQGATFGRAPETGGSVIPSPSANPTGGTNCPGLAHTPAFFSIGGSAPAFPARQGAAAPVRKKEMLPPWPRPNSLLLKNGLCVTLNAFLEWNGFQKG